MKICPVCQGSCSDEFVYCPRDAAALVPYNLKAELRARLGHNSTRDALVFLFPEEWLPQRLRREVSGAVVELRRNPRLFLMTMLRGDVDPRYRRSMSMSVAVVLTGLSISLSLTLLIIALVRPATAEVTRVEDLRPPTADDDQIVIPVYIAPPSARHGEKASTKAGGSFSQPTPPGGGGGGGQRAPMPAEQGVTAVATLEPQIVPPATEPKLQPALIVPMTVQADPRSLPELRFDIGDPRGREGTRSAGPGEGGGIGPGDGTGLGPSKGTGFGPGDERGSSGGRFALGGPHPPGNGRDDEIPWASGRVTPIIVYKEKARYTEEARQHQIQGTVILRATFSSDGRIIDIRVIRGLPNGLTENAILAAQRIRFQPALNNGVPITVRASLEFNFALY